MVVYYLWVCLVDGPIGSKVVLFYYEVAFFSQLNKCPVGEAILSAISAGDPRCVQESCCTSVTSGSRKEMLTVLVGTVACIKSDSSCRQRPHLSRVHEFLVL